MQLGSAVTSSLSSITLSESLIVVSGGTKLDKIAVVLVSHMQTKGTYLHQQLELHPVIRMQKETLTWGWPIAKEIRCAPHEQLPLSVLPHVTGALQESSSLAEEAGAGLRGQFKC